MDDINEKKMESTQNIYIIETHDELVTFLMDILEIENNVDSEEELQKKNSYRILYSLLEKILVFTVIIEDKYVERVYRDIYVFFR